MAAQLAARKIFNSILPNQHLTDDLRQLNKNNRRQSPHLNQSFQDSGSGLPLTYGCRFKSCRAQQSFQ